MSPVSVAALTADRRDVSLSDKDAHWLAGIGISLLVLGTSGAVFPDSVLACPSEYRAAIGLTIGLAAGSAKEIYDGFHPAQHNREILDIVATALGGWVGAALYWQAASITELGSGSKPSEGVLRAVSLGLASGAAAVLITLVRPERGRGKE